MNSAAVLRVIVEAQTGAANANLAKFNGELEATAAKADAAMGRVASSSEKAAIASGKRWESTGRSITKVGKTIGLATVPMALFGAASVKMSLDFRRQMGLVATDAGGTAKEVKKLERSVLGLARSSQYGPTQLAESLFHVESSGYRGAKAMRVLNEAQKLATSGNSDLQATTYALVSAVKSMNQGESLTGVTKMAAQLNEIVAHGDIRLEELTAAMSTGLIPTAKGLGLGIADVGSALDVMTKRGVPAQRSAYALNFTMQKLIPSTEKAQDVFKELGIGQEQLLKTAQAQGLPAALGLLGERLEGLTQGRQIQKIDEMFGGGRMSKGLLIAIQHVGEMKQLYGEVDGNVQLYKKHVKEAEEQPLVKIKTAWSSIQADMTEIGGDLLPVIVPGFEHLVHLADGAMHLFTAMPPGLQSSAVEAGLIGIGLSGALITTGKLVEAFGVLRGSMAGVAAMNVASSLTGGLGDLKAASALAMGGELGGFRMLGTDAAGALMGGLTTALPPLAAAAGLGDMVLTATHGDWGKVGAEAGGAVIGGIAGSFVGSPLLGAGLGAIVGGLGDDLAKSLFGGSGDKLASFQSGLSADMDRLTGASKEQKAAFEALANAGHKVVASHQRVHAAESRLVAAKRALKSTEEGFRGTRHLSIAQAIELARKEDGVRQAARQVVVAKRAEETVEKLQGVRRKITKRQLEQTVEAEKGVAERRAQQIGPLRHLLKYEEDQGASRKRIIEIGKTLLADMEARQKALAKVNEAESEAATKISPEFAKHLEQIKSAQKQFSDAMVRSTKNFERSHSVIRATDELFGANRQSVGKATQSYEHLKGALGPFRSEFHSKLGYAMADAESWSKATKLGVTGVETRFHDFASKLGIANVHFNIKGQAPQGKQQGGIVGGSGDGDRPGFAAPVGSYVLNREATRAFGFSHGGMVPLALEPGEHLFYPHEVAAIGAGNLASMNAAVPRQKGGAIGPEPMIAGPSGALRSLGQAAIHQVYKGAEDYLAKHKPKGGVATPGGGGAVVEQIGRVLFANGFNKIGAAGIIGNAYRESGWNPGAVGTGGGGLWGFTSGAISLAALQAAAGRAHVPWTDVPFQTGFMLRHGGMGLRGPLNAARSPEQAAVIFMNEWERPGIPAQGDREAGARKAFAMGYQDGGPVLYLKKGGPTDAVHWAMRHLGSTDHWGYPGEWCGAFLAADMEAVGLTPPAGFPSASSWASYGSPLGRSHIQAGAILDYGSAHVAMAISSSQQIQGNDIHGQVGTSGIGGEIGGSPLTAVRWPPYATGPGAGSGLTEKVPGSFHGAHTKALSLSGAIPKTVGGVNREIARREKELHVYRRAAQLAGSKGMAKTQQAIQHNVTALEKRLSELRRALHKLRQEVAKKHIAKRLGRKLGTVTGYEKLIESKQRDYNKLSEYASQIVDLEPQEPILSSGASEAQREAAEKLYVANFTNYVNTEERPAYQQVLEAEADWRNTILRAEIFGFGKDKPSAAHLEHRWEKNIRGVDGEIESINALTKKVGEDKAKWKAAHPKADFPTWIKDEIKKDEQGRERLPVLRFRDRELRKVLGEARGEFYPGVDKPIQPPATPLAGTGTFEGDLEDVQGVHWPDQHSLSASIPGMRVKGHFGGAIWETQGAIEELGLKIAQANASLGGSPGPTNDNSEEVELLKEELLHERMGKGLRHIEEVVSGETPRPSQLGLPYAGAYAAGGVVGALVGEKGPEIAAFPTGTRIHSASESASILSPSVVVNVYEGEGRADVEMGGKKVEAIVNRMDRRAARGAARGLARAGA